MFGSRVIEEVESKFNGTLQVRQGWGYKYVATGSLTQSGGIIGDLWSPIISNIKYPISNALILGLATGTLAQLISKKFKTARIVGVEIDPVMIALGRKYFALDKISNLEVINLDARHYLLSTDAVFDCILVDLYVGDQLPGFVYTPKFIQKLRQLGKKVVFNHLFYDPVKRGNAQRLVSRVNKIFPEVKLLRKLTNLLIICS